MDLYTENILEYFKNPKKSGHLVNPDITKSGKNTSCGDSIEIEIKIKDDKVEDIAFTGQGCAISQAATSMLFEKIVGMKIEEIKNLDEEYIKNLLKVEISFGRRNCAMLGLNTLKEALSK